MPERRDHNCDVCPSPVAPLERYQRPYLTPDGRTAILSGHRGCVDAYLDEDEEA